MGWSAQQYARFLDDRTRPARDLLMAVPLTAPRLVVDLGCGPGNSTALLAARYPGARTLGLDCDPDMLAAARRSLPGLRFQHGRIQDWHPEAPPDLIFANAVLQWLDGHEVLFPRLVGLLAPGGALAVQMPDNLDEPSHAAMRRIARRPEWAGRLADAETRRRPLIAPARLHALLRPLCRRLDIWHTVYQVELAGLDAIVEWFKGSALRPYLVPLDRAERAAFLAAYRAEIAPAYPESGGRALLAFPRYFFVAEALD
ncbi:MAG: trans-aconitate 2-methyltransferase [Paracoccus sp. (in: a-proteobacteria)]|uniref:trans-aconitate 2-methyltransferase n=1 Tax=Paracoccus sp. TaxID=267 RepID=UPI0039E54C0A